MKKMFFLLVALVVIACVNSFGYINVPKDSIPSFVLETAQKNNIENPNLIFPDQEILIYLGSCVKLPVFVTAKEGDNLNKIIRNVIKEMSPLEKDNRNLICELLRDQEKLVSSLVSSQQSDQKDPTIPPAEVRWSITGLIILALIIAVLLDRLKEYK